MELASVPFLQESPGRVAHQRGKLLCEAHHELGRPGERVAPASMALAFDALVGVAEQLRAIGAHQVEVARAIRVPQIRALAARDDLRVVVWQGGGGLVPVRAARNDHLGPLPELPVVRSRPTHVISYARR